MDVFDRVLTANFKKSEAIRGYGLVFRRQVLPSCLVFRNLISWAWAYDADFPIWSNENEASS